MMQTGIGIYEFKLSTDKYVYLRPIKDEKRGHFCWTAEGNQWNYYYCYGLIDIFKWSYNIFFPWDVTTHVYHNFRIGIAKL